MEVVVITGVNLRAKLQSNRHHQQTKTQIFFTGSMPFFLRNQQCQSTEGKYSDLDYTLQYGLPLKSNGFFHGLCASLAPNIVNIGGVVCILLLRD